MPALVNALKSVDFPTLGKPTMPHCKAMRVLKYKDKIEMAYWRRCTGRQIGHYSIGTKKVSIAPVWSNRHIGQIPQH
jgi:hypothetical protein